MHNLCNNMLHECWPITDILCGRPPKLTF